MSIRSITMSEIASRIEQKTGVKPNLSKNVIKAMQEVVAEEIAAGNPVTLSGFVKFSHGYKAPLKKGREVRDPKTGETHKAESGRPAEITVRARVLTNLKSAAPSPTSKAGKPIVEAAKARAAAAAQRKAEREAEQS